MFYVLIIITAMASGGDSVTTQEFSGIERCEAAKSAILSADWSWRQAPIIICAKR